MDSVLQHRQNSTVIVNLLFILCHAFGGQFKVLLFCLPLFLFLAMLLLFVLLVGGVLGTQTPSVTGTGQAPVSGTALTNALAIASQLKEEGATSAGIAGALANAQRESDFEPNATNSGGGVAGWFQWSGFSNHNNGSRITQGGFIEAGDTSSLTNANEAKLLDYELNHGYSSVKAELQTVTDPQTASDYWTAHYEEVSLSDPQAKVSVTEGYAKAWYSYLTGANTATGVGSSTVPAGFSLGDTPAPNMSFIGADNNYPYGQCTWYVYGRARQLGITFSPTMGNGGEWMNAAGYTVTMTPTLHAAVSFSAGQAGAGAPYGHVAFVEQVRSDGSILILESNFTGPNGGGLGILDYRTFSASEAKQFHYVIGK